MKTYFFISILFLSISNTSFSQDSIHYNRIIKVAPLDLFNKLRLSYEVDIKDKKSIGFYTSYTYRRVHFNEENMIKSVKVEPFIRFYFSGKNSLKGFYFQPMAKMGLFFVVKNEQVVSLDYNAQGDLINYTRISSQYEYDDLNKPYSKSIFSFGGGLNIGYQTFFGSDKRWSFDINTGIQYWWFNTKAYKKSYSDKIEYSGNGDYTIIRQSNYNFSKGKFRELTSGQEYFPSLYITVGYKF